MKLTRWRLIAVAIVALIAYLVLVRGLLIGYLFDNDLLGWASAVIDRYNRATNNSFGVSPHPIDEFRQRLDILLAQLILVGAATLAAAKIFASRSRVLLLTINLVLLAGVLLVTEQILSTEQMQRRFGSVQHEDQDREINRVNRTRTNSLGFTDRERTRQKPAGTYRIVVLGDSFVWGDGVSDLDDIWSHVLEQMLVERFGSAIEVLSWGKSGWNTQDQLGFLQKEGSAFEMDLLIVGFVDNDPHLRRKSMARRMFMWDKLTVRHIPYIPNTARFLSGSLNEFLYGLSYFQNWGYAGWTRALYRQDNLELYEEVLRDFRDLLADRKIDGFFVSLPTARGLSGDEEWSAMSKLFARNDIEFLNLYPVVQEAYRDMSATEIREKTWTNPVNAHPSRALAQLYATETFEYLLKRRGLKLSVRDAK